MAHFDASAADVLVNIVAKGEFVDDKQFPLLPRYFQLFSKPILSFIDVFKVVCKRFVVCGKGLKQDAENIE